MKKKPKYIKSTDFTLMHTPKWLKRFKNRGIFTTRRRRTMYKPIYFHYGRERHLRPICRDVISQRPELEHEPFAILESCDSWYQYIVTKDNHQKYIEA